MAVRDLDDARDRELVRRVRDGDEEAFRALFGRYGAAGKALATRIVRQGHLAEEIVQEAFLALWTKPEGYREERGTFRAWLMSTVHHRAVDLVRREEAQRRRAEEWHGEGEQEDVGEEVVERMDRGEHRERVLAALGELPTAQREVLELMYYEGKTQSVIAGELGLPLGTVKSRTLLGMKRLRAHLTEGTA